MEPTGQNGWAKPPGARKIQDGLGRTCHEQGAQWHWQSMISHLTVGVAEGMATPFPFTNIEGVTTLGR